MEPCGLTRRTNPNPVESEYRTRGACLRSMSGLLLPAALLLGLEAIQGPTLLAATADCSATAVGVDTSLAHDKSGVVFGEALGQTFVAPETLIKSITVWRTAIQDTNHAGIKLYITETDSTGYPRATSVILDGPIVVVPYGDGVHPVRFDFVFDPPFALPRKGQYCLAVQARPCDATWNLVASRQDPYPGGHLWVFGRSTCFLRTSPTPYSFADLGFEVAFCGVPTPVQRATWGKIKTIYRP